MNERIQELAEQAWKYTNDTISERDVGFNQDAFEEKFAELLIKECVNVGINAFHADNSVVPVFPAAAIKQHFGVE